MSDGHDAQGDAAGFVELASALEVLRSELEEAWEAGQGKRIRFRVSAITLTLQAVARWEREVGGKLRWYVLEAGGGAKSAEEATQTLVLTLSPGVYNENGELVPLDVYGDQAQPGR